MRSWLAWEAGCLADFVLWWLVVPAALAFIWLVLFGGDLVVVPGWTYGLVIAVLIVAFLVVLCTALFGHHRAKKMAADLRAGVNETNQLTGASPQSVERVDNPAHLGRSVIVTRDFTVTREYFEDIIEPDELGWGGYEYRYWDYTFDFRSRAYRARVYTDEPGRANVFRNDMADVMLDDPSELEHLRAIRGPLEADPLPGQVEGKRVEIWVLGRRGDGYVQVSLGG